VLVVRGVYIADPSAQFIATNRALSRESKSNHWVACVCMRYRWHEEGYRYSRL